MPLLKKENKRRPGKDPVWRREEGGGGLVCDKEIWGV